VIDCNEGTILKPIQPNIKNAKPLFGATFFGA